MKVAFLSTASISQTSRGSIAEIQAELAKAQQEVSSGKHYDAGLVLGYRVGRAVSMRQEFDQLNAIGETNGILSERLSMTQNVLDQLIDGAQNVMSTLLSVRNAVTGQNVATIEAKAMIDTMTELLNTGHGGVRLFGGINTDNAPLNAYYGTPASAAKTAVDADFLAAFGFTQSSPAVSTIDAATLQTFLDGAFAANFDPAPWAANWSLASDQKVNSRISISMTVETSASINEQPFRDLTRAMTMVADLGGENLNQNAYQALADTAIGLIGNAITGLTVKQSTLGVAEEEIRKANERMELQKQVLTGAVLDLEGVDQFEVSTRATMLLTQLETSFALTARIQRLSFTNYI
jgi:flagellar hook-associated protein 3 FlgL